MNHFIEYWLDCGCVANQCRCPGPKETRYRLGSCAKCKPLTVTLADQTGMTSTPTPPDFDAALDEMETACEIYWAGIVPSDVQVARQRVRELYEAVVRERDAARETAKRLNRRVQDFERTHPERRGFQEMIHAQVQRDRAYTELAELRAAQQGDVMEVVGHRYHTDGRPTLTVAGLYGEQIQTGDKVRVARVEEAP